MTWLDAWLQTNKGTIIERSLALTAAKNGIQATAAIGRPGYVTNIAAVCWGDTIELALKELTTSLKRREPFTEEKTDG